LQATFPSKAKLSKPKPESVSASKSLAQSTAAGLSKWLRDRRNAKEWRFNAVVHGLDHVLSGAKITYQRNRLSLQWTDRHPYRRLLPNPH